MNYLEAVNRVLTKIGDSEVKTVYATNRSSRVAQIVRDALMALASESNSWPWLNGQYSFDTWVGNKATVNRNILSVHSIVHKNYGHTPIRYVPPEIFFLNKSTPYDSVAGSPTMWTIVGEDFYLTPYPTTSETQGNIILYAALLPQVPLADLDNINIPLRDENLLIYRACIDACTDIIDDGNKANQYAALYNQQLMQAKHRMLNRLNKGSLIPTEGPRYA